MRGAVCERAWKISALVPELAASIRRHAVRVPLLLPMLPMSLVPVDYPAFLTAITQRVRAAQYQALQLVNREQLQLYWDLGHLIADRQQQAGWGKSIVETLARDLQAEFVGLAGFSASNLWRMRAFYLAYADDEVLAPLVRELGWSLNVLILEKSQSAAERLFYVTQARQYHWTKATLVQQLKAQAYQKTVTAQHNFAQTVPPPAAGRGRVGPERRIPI